MLKVKKITIEQFDRIRTSRERSGLNSELRKIVLALEPGEGINIAREDWTLKTAPICAVSKLRKESGYVLKAARTITGWAILRK